MNFLSGLTNNDSGFIWIIVLILIFSLLGDNSCNTCGCNNNDCGCQNDNGGNWIWLVVLALLFLNQDDCNACSSC